MSRNLEIRKADEIDRFVQEITKPLYVLRMARPRENEDSSFGHGCKKRADNAREEIRQAIKKYLAGTVIT